MSRLEVRKRTAPEGGISQLPGKSSMCTSRCARKVVCLRSRLRFCCRFAYEIEQLLVNLAKGLSCGVVYRIRALSCSACRSNASRFLIEAPRKGVVGGANLCMFKTGSHPRPESKWLPTCSGCAPNRVQANCSDREQFAEDIFCFIPLSPQYC